MEQIQFDWDEAKNLKNIQKHGIRFEDAVTVFYDDDAILFDDPDHSVGEERFLILGIIERTKGSLTGFVGIVCHCYHDEDTIRIISARKATKREKRYYISQLGGDYDER